ncbi:MAG TPA: Eco57I restriction-modification methylase domain-containing protein [Thermodesulfobacteriota bacterium]|nr:Eco57I restriction-modification methylase domain-containing protein [Thermodesulfobacteriota bacterium]
MQVHLAGHLPKDEIIHLGSYYTPEELVHKVYDFIQPYIDNKGKKVVLFDSAGGCGAFLFGIKQCDYRIADRDLEACEFLKQHFDRQKVFHTNSLIEVSREKYFISPSTFLIMIGNPPYNDTTSEFKSGEKGQNICDEDLYDRDIGVSFLKSYHKLNADVVCVLHPLSYLIKETNFNRLRDFKDNYKLIRGNIFSSALFHGTGTGKFPILVALYEKNVDGTTFEDIKNFRFNILDSPKTFVLSNFKTTDGYINKYPPRKNDVQKSPIGLYYYSFRDFNSLKKNTSFFTKEHPNGIVVTLENFYKYSYLYSLKSLFNPEDAWLYGNLSPLVHIEDVEQNKKLYVLYAIKTNKVFKNMKNSILKKITEYYKIKLDKTGDAYELEKVIKNKLIKLI